LGRVIDLGKLYDPSKNKRQMIAHQASERYILYGGAYGGGKTAWLISEAIRLSLMTSGNRGFLGCKDGTDFKRNALLQLLKFLPPELYAPPLGVHHQSDQYFKLINGSYIYYGGLGNDAEAVKLISNMPELGWFGIDQAEEITENQFLLLTGRLRLNLPGIKYKGLLTANPDPGWLRNRFIEQDKPDHLYIPALPKDNPFLPDGYEEKLREIYPAEMVRRLMEGDWDIPGIDYLIPYSLIRDAVNREMPAAGVKVAGVDVSRYGDDQTVFLIRQGNKVLDIVAWSHMDTAFSAGRVADLIREWKPLVTNIDSIGVGAGVFDPLRAEGFAVREVNVAEKASDETQYLNKRAEYYKKLAKRFEMGEISLPDHASLASNLASLKYKYVKTKLQIESKEVARARGEKSPDFADALMLAFIDGGNSQEVTAYVDGVKVL